MLFFIAELSITCLSFLLCLFFHRELFILFCLNKTELNLDQSCFFALSYESDVAQQTFWIVIARKSQVQLITLMITMHYKAEEALMRLLVTPVSNLSNVLLSHFTLLPSGLTHKKRRKGNRNHRLRYMQCPDACSVVTLRVFARNAPMFVQIEIHGVRSILSMMLSSFGRIWQRRHMKIYIFLFQRCFCIYTAVLYSSIA